MNRNLFIISAIIILAAAAFLLFQRFGRESFELPKGKPSEEIVVELEDDEKLTEKKIMVTDGVKHSIPLEEIISGGPPKDGIPSIDNPKFISVEEANQWLGDDEPGVAFSLGDTHRFYPYQILVWHEIVNDTVQGQRVLITYCPLCLTGFIFDPVVQGERVEFGTSGKLWKSNLVMYDRKTDSLWPQILGEAVVGEMTGTRLKTLPSDQITYGAFKKAHSQGQVLSRDTGAARFYGSNPYGNYFQPVSFALSLVGSRDTRLPAEAYVFGIVVDGKAKAYFIESVKNQGEVKDTFEGKNFVLKHDKDLDVVRVYEKLPDGSEVRINPFSSFWFSWAAAYPDSELYK